VDDADGDGVWSTDGAGAPGVCAADGPADAVIVATTNTARRIVE
jgi:hypothetical protein